MYGTYKAVFIFLGKIQTKENRDKLECFIQ